jgi:hypothetical protein
MTTPCEIAPGIIRALDQEARLQPFENNPDLSPDLQEEVKLIRLQLDGSWKKMAIASLHFAGSA